MWWCHWTLHIWFPIDIYSNCMSISHRLALIATQNVFSYLLSLGTNYEKSNVHWMISKWPWMLQGQKYPIYVIYYPRVPNFTPFFALRSFFFPGNWGFWFLHRLQWWIWNFRKKIFQNWKLKIPQCIFVRTMRKIQDKFEKFGCDL